MYGPVHLVLMVYGICKKPVFNPLYSDRFSNTDKSNKDGIVHYIFEGVTGCLFPIMIYFCPWGFFLT